MIAPNVGLSMASNGGGGGRSERHNDFGNVKFNVKYTVAVVFVYSVLGFCSLSSPRNSDSEVAVFVCSRYPCTPERRLD